MSNSTVEQFAAESKMSVERMLEHLKKHGINKNSGSDMLTDADKAQLSAQTVGTIRINRTKVEKTTVDGVAVERRRSRKVVVPSADEQLAAAKAAQEAEKASSAAKREAQKTEEAWVKAFEKTGGSAEELAKIKQPLRDAGIVADETAAKVGNIGGEAQKAAQAVEAAFAKIGVDVGQVTDGIGQKARQAFKDFQTASDEAKKAGIEHSALIRAGFEQMMAKLESRQEFAAFERQLKQSGDAAALTREQMQRLNDAAKNGAGERQYIMIDVDKIIQAVFPCFLPFHYGFPFQSKPFSAQIQPCCGQRRQCLPQWPFSPARPPYRRNTPKQPYIVIS